LTWQQVVTVVIIGIAVLIVAWGRSASGREALEHVYGPLAPAPLFAKRQPGRKRSRAKARAVRKPARKTTGRRSTPARRGATRAR
jgi:hypothetical protein